MGEVTDTHYSVELCGGTHVNALGDIALVTIVSEGAVASGIRRIEALTGEAARLHLARRESQLKDIASMLKTAPDEVAARVESLLTERRAMEKELSETKTKLALSGGDGAAAEPEAIGDLNFLGQIVNGLDPKELRGLLDQTKARLGSGVAAVIAINDGRASIGIAVTDDHVGNHNAVDLVRAGVEILGGSGGGGKPGFAQGGGPDGSKADAALAAVRALLAG